MKWRRKGRLQVLSDDVPCGMISKGCKMDELQSSPGIAYVLELVAPVFSNTFCETLCMFLFVKPVEVPHRKQAGQNPVTKTRHGHYTWED
jgi:hypothetical protein